eukprot:Rhum_TRINITY_DN14531_c14_g1::Rhum_TRINITY_DN14531_c14_g1_i1::g.97795::m.97795
MLVLVLFFEGRGEEGEGVRGRGAGAREEVLEGAVRKRRAHCSHRNALSSFFCVGLLYVACVETRGNTGFCVCRGSVLCVVCCGSFGVQKKKLGRRKKQAERRGECGEGGREGSTRRRIGVFGTPFSQRSAHRAATGSKPRWAGVPPAGRHNVCRVESCSAQAATRRRSLATAAGGCACCWCHAAAAFLHDASQAVHLSPHRGELPVSARQLRGEANDRLLFGSVLSRSLLGLRVVSVVKGVPAGRSSAHGGVFRRRQRRAALLLLRVRRRRKQQVEFSLKLQVLVFERHASRRTPPLHRLRRRRRRSGLLREDALEDSLLRLLLLQATLLHELPVGRLAHGETQGVPLKLCVPSLPLRLVDLLLEQLALLPQRGVLFAHLLGGPTPLLLLPAQPVRLAPCLLQRRENHVVFPRQRRQPPLRLRVPLLLAGRVLRLAVSGRLRRRRPRRTRGVSGGRGRRPPGGGHPRLRRPAGRLRPQRRRRGGSGGRRACGSRARRSRGAGGGGGGGAGGARGGGGGTRR